MSGKVKGSILQSRMAFVRERIGADAIDRVLARLDAADRLTLQRALMPFAWYEFDLNERLDRAIAAEAGHGNDIFLQLGAKSADDNLTSASQQHYIHDRNTQALLKNTSAIYGVYYDTGRRDYERVSDNVAVLRTFDSESFSAADCLTVVGWYERAIAMCGGRNVRVTQSACRANGDAICEYRCEWE
jgi:hypothetical protein